MQPWRGSPSTRRAPPRTWPTGANIRARLAIAADGRDSRLREAERIRIVAWDYGQTGIVATVEHERPHNGVAYEHFLPAGPFAILPMPGNRSSLVWVEKTERCRAHDGARRCAL